MLICGCKLLSRVLTDIVAGMNNENLLTEFSVVAISLTFPPVKGLFISDTISIIIFLERIFKLVFCGSVLFPTTSEHHLVSVYEYYTPGLELRLKLPKKRPCLLILQAKSLEFHRQIKRVTKKS